MTNEWINKTKKIFYERKEMGKTKKEKKNTIIACIRTS